MNVLDQNIKRDGSEVILDFFLKEKKKRNHVEALTNYFVEKSFAGAQKKRIR